MLAQTFQGSQHPIVYADQKHRKLFVLSEDRSYLIPPSEIQLEDKHGNICLVPITFQGDMTVLDVRQLSSGGYLLKILGLAQKAIRVILF
ncbi:MAG: hypothetical protein RLP15_13885 [Cryomorphaceae bacterium]